MDDESDQTYLRYFLPTITSKGFDHFLLPFTFCMSLVVVSHVWHGAGVLSVSLPSSVCLLMISYNMPPSYLFRLRCMHLLLCRQLCR